MGDNLPELLYRAWCSAMGLSYGSDETPDFHNLRTDARDAWEQVAAKARNEMIDWVFTCVDSIMVDAAHHVVDGRPEEWSPMALVYELRDRFGR